jgi:hypothetical protein
MGVSQGGIGLRGWPPARRDESASSSRDKRSPIDRECSPAWTLKLASVWLTLQATMATPSHHELWTWALQHAELRAGDVVFIPVDFANAGEWRGRFMPRGDRDVAPRWAPPSANALTPARTGNASSCEGVTSTTPRPS